MKTCTCSSKATNSKVLAAQTYEQHSSRRQTTALLPQLLLLLLPQAPLLLRLLLAVGLAALPLQQQQQLGKAAALRLGLRCCSSSIPCMRSVS
jgi:hypothetical protein